MAECILLKSGGGTGSDDCTATKANVLSGYTAVTKDSDDEATAGTMANRGAWTSRIGVNGKAVIPEGYHDGKGYVEQAIANRGAVNASLPINGTYTIPEGYHSGAGKVTQNIATMGAQTVTPGNSQKVVSCSGKYMTGNVTVPAVSNLTAANIKKGVNVGGVVGTWEGYVAAATDLYYNGINNAGFSLIGNSNSRFDSNQITIPFGSGGIGLVSSNTYNLTGYRSIVIEGLLRTDTAGVKRIKLYYIPEGGAATEISSVQYANTILYNVTLSFNIQAYGRLQISIGHYSSDNTVQEYIRRVRLT